MRKFGSVTEKAINKYADHGALDCDPRRHGPPVVQLNDKRLYAMIFSVNDCPRKNNRNTGKFWANWRCRGHKSGKQTIKCGQYRFLIDLLGCSPYWGMKIKKSILK